LTFRLDLSPIRKLDTTALLSQSESQAQPDEHREGRGMAKTRVFVSFDFDNDQALKTFIIGQAKNPGSPFEVTDGSLEEAQPQGEW